MNVQLSQTCWNGVVFVSGLPDIKPSNQSASVYIYIIFTFMHLADTFIQSDLQCIQHIHLLSVCVFPGNRTHNLCAANAVLYHWATGTCFIPDTCIAFSLFICSGASVSDEFTFWFICPQTTGANYFPHIVFVFLPNEMWNFVYKYLFALIVVV